MNLNPLAIAALVMIGIAQVSQAWIDQNGSAMANAKRHRFSISS